MILILKLLEHTLSIYLEYICQVLHDIKVPKGASAATARDVLIRKKLNKCTLKIYVCTLLLDRPHPVWYLNNRDPKTSCLPEIEITVFDWAKT